MDGRIMLEKIIDLTNQYIDSMPKNERKKYGQFFTSMEQHVSWLDYMTFQKIWIRLKF